MPACLQPTPQNRQELLDLSASAVKLNTSVARIVGSAKEGYSLFGGAGEKLGTFDAVVIATPISLAGITLDIRGEVIPILTITRISVALY